MAGARRFEELTCWQLAYELHLEVQRTSDCTPFRQDLGFRDQLRDAAASASRNIAEGFGRRTHADFARFLDVARGSLMECQHHLLDAADRRYIDSTDRDRLILLARRTGGAIAALQRYLRRKP